jgi:FMN reductase
MSRIAVVSAGFSQPSSTRLLADRLAAATGLPADVFELREHAHDVVNNLLTGFPSAGLRTVLDAVRSADGLIAVTPTFNASYNGLFKSFFDVFDEGALAGKPVLIGATGGSARHSLVLDHALRPMFSYLGSIVAPTGVFAAAEDWAGAAGIGGALRDRVERAGREFADLVSAAGRTPRKAADPFALTRSFEELLAD